MSASLLIAEVVGLLLLIGGIHALNEKTIRPRQDRTDEKVRELRDENTRQHAEGAQRFNHLSDQIQTHITVDHAKIIEGMARMEERQKALIERNREQRPPG